MRHYTKGNDTDLFWHRCNSDIIILNGKTIKDRFADIEDEESRIIEHVDYSWEFEYFDGVKKLYIVKQSANQGKTRKQNDADLRNYIIRVAVLAVIAIALSIAALIK